MTAALGQNHLHVVDNALLMHVASGQGRLRHEYSSRRGPDKILNFAPSVDRPVAHRTLLPAAERKEELTMAVTSSGCTLAPVAACKCKTEAAVDHQEVWSMKIKLLEVASSESASCSTVVTHFRRPLPVVPRRRERLGSQRVTSGGTPARRNATIVSYIHLTE